MDLNLNNLNYSLYAIKNDYFAINITNGVISLQKSLYGNTEQIFNMEVGASDGLHETRVPLKVIKKIIKF